jgi:hypothetical protein
MQFARKGYELKMSMVEFRNRVHLITGFPLTWCTLCTWMLLNLTVSVVFVGAGYALLDLLH